MTLGSMLHVSVALLVSPAVEDLRTVRSKYATGSARGNRAW